jgi:hypothetical protein
MRFAALVVGLVCIVAARAAPGPLPNVEIEYLLSAVAESGCRFERNGTWYGSQAAAAHLRAKYEAMAAKDLIKTADDFIDKAATRSSLSGREYSIQCEGRDQMPARQWLTERLRSRRLSGVATGGRPP